MFKRNKLTIDEKIDQAIVSYLIRLPSYQGTTKAIIKLRDDLNKAEDKYEATEAEIFTLMDKTNELIGLKDISKENLISQYLQTIGVLEIQAEKEEDIFYDILDQLEPMDDRHDELRAQMRKSQEKIRNLYIQKRKGKQ
jgi:hypothetical protein